MYLNDSSWVTVDMSYDESTHLYYASIPLPEEGGTIHYKIYAEDVLGNWAESETFSYTIQVPTEPSAHNLVPYIIGTSISAVAVVAIIIILKKRKIL